MSNVSLYGPQSELARFLEQPESRHPDPVARELGRRLLSELRGRVIEIGCGDGRAFELYPPESKPYSRSSLTRSPGVSRWKAAPRLRTCRSPLSTAAPSAIPPRIAKKLGCGSETEREGASQLELGTVASLTTSTPTYAKDADSTIARANDQRRYADAEAAI
jgi:hypothetical protein